MGSTSKTDLSNSRSSVINGIRAKAGKSDFVVTSFDDFCRKQKADKVGASKKKGEAANILHDFRGNSAGNITKKTSIRNPVSVRESYDFAAANRAAAALYVRSDDVFEPGVVKNLSDFYHTQRYQRDREATTRRMQATKNYHRYSNLLSKTSSLQVNSCEVLDSNKQRSVSIVKKTEAARQKELEGEASTGSGGPKQHLKVEALTNENGQIDLDEFQPKRLTDSSELSNSIEGSSVAVVKEGQSGRQEENPKVTVLTYKTRRLNGDNGQYKESADSSELLNSNEEIDASVVTGDRSGILKESLEVEHPTSKTGRINVDETEDKKSIEAKKETLAEAQVRRVIFDFKKSDYRSFIFVVHEQHGLLLLHCTRKKNKGPHHQLPGGHIDEPEFLMAATKCQDAHAQLIIAAQAGATRELYEETGIDVRDKPFRLEPAALRNEVETNESGKLMMTCELKKRLYFFLTVTDEDFLQESDIAEDNDANIVEPMSAIGSNLRLKLSVEHSGFEFEKDPEKAAELLSKHSGGNGSKALLLAMQRERKAEPSCDLIEKEAPDESNEDLDLESGPENDSPLDLLPAPKRDDLSWCWKFCFP